MTTDRQLTGIVRSWLREDRREDAGRVLDLVLDDLATTPQRGAGRLTRGFLVHRTVLYGIAAAAAVVVVAALVGLNLLGGSNVGAPTPTSTPTPTATPSPTPTVAPTPAGFPAGAIPPGRYHQTQESVPYSVAISSELWQSDQLNTGYGFIETRNAFHAFPNPGYVWITFLSRLDAVSIDPCAGTQTAVTSMDDAAAALTQIAGTDAVGPTDTSIDGVPAKLVVLTISGDFACDMKSFWLYGAVSFYPDSKDSVIRDWVFDRDGQTYLLHTDQIGSDPVLGDEIEQIVGSIRFE